jgi:hypothetical protein
MLGKITLAAGVIALGAAFAPIGASAAPALPQSKLVTAPDALVHQVGRRHHGHHRHHGHFRRHHHHRGRIFIGVGVGGGYCSTWRYECARRWGWHTRGYYRCLWRHGC